MAVRRPRGTTSRRRRVGFLGYNNHRDPARLLSVLRQALEGFEAKAVAAIDAGEPDPRFVYGPPDGGLVVRVNSRILGGYEPTSDRWRQQFQQAMGRDNLWIRKDEHEALVRGEVPASLVTRLARFHLVDNTRGEPPMWKAEEIMARELRLENGILRGEIHLRTASGEREFRADLFGYVETANGAVTRLDLVAKGAFRGEGRYTRGAPEGEFPLAIAFRLADGTDLADGVPPQGSRGWLDGYLRAE